MVQEEIFFLRQWQCSCQLPGATGRSEKLIEPAQDLCDYWDLLV